MQGATAIAKILKMEGIEFISGVPINALFEEGAKEGIRPIITRNERVGVGIADGFTRASNGTRIGVSAMQSGPGAENAFPGVAQAFSDSVPILVLPSGPARRRYLARRAHRGQARHLLHRAGRQPAAFGCHLRPNRVRPCRGPSR